MPDGLSSTQITQLIVLGAYLVGLVGIGLLATQAKATMEEYFLANRDLGAWVSGISSAASSESGWVTLGAVGMGYAMGLSAAWFIPGCLLGYVINWYLIAPRLRKISKNRNLITVPDFLEDRTQDKDRIVRIVAVVIIFIAMAAYVGAQFKAAGKLFQSLFFQDSTWGRNIGIIIGAAITIFYTFFGGFRAVSWTDLAQGLIMIVGLVVFPIYLIFSIGGFGEFVSKLGDQRTRSWITYQVEYEGNGFTGSTEKTFEPLANRKHQSLLFPKNKEESFQVKSININRNGNSNTNNPPALIFSAEKLKPLNKQEQNGTRRYAYYVTTNRSGTSLPVYRVKEGSASGLNLSPVNIGAQSLKQETTPVRLKTGYTYFVGEKIRLRPVQLKGINPESRELTNHSLIHGNRDLVDPFGSFNNYNRPESKEDSGPWIPIPAALGFVVGMLGIGLGYPGMPHVMNRFMATRNQEKISQGRVIACLWGIGAFYGAILVGMLARIKLSPTDIPDQEFAFPLLASRELSPILSGILVAAILAAIMSTADSMIIVAVAGVSRDLYNKILRPDAPETRLVWISRITVIVLGTLGVVAAILNVQLIFWFVLVAWGILGSAFGPPLILSVFWKGLSRMGVLAGMIVGAVTVLVWQFVPSLSISLFGYTIYSLVPGFALSFLATWLVSLITRSPENPEELMAMDEPDGGPAPEESPTPESMREVTGLGPDSRDAKDRDFSSPDEPEDTDGPAPNSDPDPSGDRPDPDDPPSGPNRGPSL